MTSYVVLKTTSLGDLLLVATEDHLIGVYFLHSKHAPSINDWKLDANHPVLKQTGIEIQEYLQGKRTSFSLPLHYDGTDFQRKVWHQIERIPFGKTISYTELAKRAGAPNAIRAAGTATGRNPLSLVIPCHRVLGKNGAIGGYAGGLDKKCNLLESEMNNRPK